MTSILDLKRSLSQDVMPIPADKNRTAAVLLLLIDKPEIEIIFTQRSSFVQNHKQQVSFPGGAVEDEDADLFHTALRESCEEIHVCSDSIKFVGSLPIFKTHYGLNIYPFVASVKSHEINSMHANEEVDAIFTVPLDWLRSEENWYLQDYLSPEGMHRQIVFYQPYQGYQIWGITAAILHDFLKIA